jgi:LDH2 family malate/lactate/ureidoglycolate dehydrogenase
MKPTRRHATLQRRAEIVDLIIDQYNRVRKRKKFPKKAVADVLQLLFPHSSFVGRGFFKEVHAIRSRAHTRVLKVSNGKSTNRDAWMSGRSAYYVEMIARAGFVVIHTASSSRTVAPIGGKQPALGTNPIAFGIPGCVEPVVFDMGTSAFMMTEVMLRERLGQLLPGGVALGPDGEPTRDPAAARRGALLPFGGHKGFGLAFMVQALGLLAGSALDAESDNGYLFVAFKPDLLMPADEFKRQISNMIERIKATPRQPGIDEIRIASERAYRSRERALREGIEIDRAVHDALRELSTRTG